MSTIIRDAHIMDDIEDMFVGGFFDYMHLRDDLKTISEPFCLMAHNYRYQDTNNSETIVMLRKLLEAKDAAVRAFILHQKRNTK